MNIRQNIDLGEAQEHQVIPFEASERILTQSQLQELLRDQVRSCPASGLEQGHNLFVPEWAGSDYHKYDPKNPAQVRALARLQQNYLRGFPDVDQRIWCWQCYERVRMMFLGYEGDYLPIPRGLLGLVDGSPSWCSNIDALHYAGADVWFAVASHAANTIIADVTWHFEKGEGKDLIIVL